MNRVRAANLDFRFHRTGPNYDQRYKTKNTESQRPNINR